LEEAEGACSSRLGDELRTLDDEEVAEKDCSKGLGSRSKSERVWRALRVAGWWEALGSGEREELFLDMRGRRDRK
jgi:hypothetical protein